jgi:hypothetical protein
MGLDLDGAIDAVDRVGAAGRPDSRIRPLPRPTLPARDVTRDDRRALRLDPEEKTWLPSPE